MNIEVKQIASDLWEAYDLDEPEAKQTIGSAPSEEELESIISEYEAKNG
jgi:hypothetical protein